MRFLAAMLFPLAACLAQAPLSLTLSNGVHLSIETSLGNPTGQQVIHAEMTAASGDSFYRVFRDQNGLTVYAYVLEVDRPTDQTLRMAVKPAGDDFARRFGNPDGGKPTPTVAETRVLSLVESTARVPFEVFQMPGTAEKVIDTIELKIEPAVPSGNATGRLRFAGVRVSSNHVALSPVSTGDVAGRYVMFYIPGRGGYFFSSEPVPGRPFIQAGSIDQSHMQFTIENESYECTAAAPILGHSGSGTVWVYHDRTYKPTGNWTDPLDAVLDPTRPPLFFTAASNTLNWWLSR